MVTAQEATLSDYTAMVEFMAREFVTEAFAVYNHSQGMMQFCC